MGTSNNPHNRVPCPIRGCTSRRKRDQVMCVGHWFQVPEPLRKRIWELYRNAPASAEHLAAIREAIETVNLNGAAAAPTSAA